jgi:hypothetical protein
MRYKFGLIFLLGFCIGCEKSEKLDENEMHYVFTTIALTKARIASHDSVQLTTKLDSVYKKFGTNEVTFKKQTTDFAQQPDRAGIIFRAIADSMNVK